MFRSKMIDKGTSSGQKGYEVNTRCIMGFREIGAGLDLIKTFSRIMNSGAHPENKLTVDNLKF